MSNDKLVQTLTKRPQSSVPGIVPGAGDVSKQSKVPASYVLQLT